MFLLKLTIFIFMGNNIIFTNFKFIKQYAWHLRYIVTFKNNLLKYMILSSIDVKLYTQKITISPRSHSSLKFILFSCRGPKIGITFLL